MSLRSWVVQCLTAVVVVAMTSCSDTTIAPNPQAGSLRLSITPTALTLQEGETHPVQAVVTDRNGVAIPSLSSSVQWSSSAGDTVQVSGDIAHALLPGHAHVYAVLNAEGVSLSDSISVTVTPVAASIQIVQGDAQRAPVNSMLATPLEVRVLDPHGGPVAGYMVRFIPSASGGQVNPDSVATDASGDARTEWTLPGTPGSYTVSVDAGSLQGSPASFTATALILQPASALRIQPDSVVLPAIQDTAHLSASVYGADGQLINGWEPTWTSMDPSIVSVDRYGVVQALGSGRVGVIASVPGAADTTTIIVHQAVGYLQITGARELASVGDTVRLGILLLDPNGFPIVSGQTVTWSSSAPAVASVDSSGLVTATGYGSTTITASASFLRSRVNVPVSPRVAQINITPSFYAASAGDTVRLTATALDKNDHTVSNHVTYVWSSSNSKVARVDQTGLVTAIANGSATISAASDSVDGEAAINVGGSTAMASRITLSPSTAALHAIGDTLRLAAVALDSAGGAISAPSITWSSLDPAIASVNGAGRVQALATGKARIRGADGSAADTAVITIDQVPASVSISPASVSLTQGDSARLSASVFDSMDVAIPGVSVSWSASNADISVSSSGMVHAVSAGSAIATATSGNVNNSVSVAVTGTQTTVRRLVTTPSTMSLNALGDTATIQAVAYDSSGTPVAGAAVAWRSLNPGVVTVNASGRITANAVGLAFIVASSVCCTAADTTSVAVSQVVTSVSVSPTQLSLTIGGSQSLSAIAYDAGGSAVPGAPFTWKSSAPSVASVNSSGVVAAVGAGSATITATSGAAGGAASVTVVSAMTTLSAPSYNSGTDSLLYVDSMNAYTTATAMGATNTGRPQIVPLPSPVGDGRPVNTSQIQVITDGHERMALRMHYSGAYQDNPTLWLMNSPHTNGSQTNYFQYWARISSTVADAPGGLNVKWFEAWHVVQSGYRIQWMTHWPSSDDPVKSLYGYNAVWGACEGGCDSNPNNQDFADQPFGPYPLHNLADGQWHLYTFAYKPNSSSGANDAFARMWVDGKMIVDCSQSTVGVTPPGGLKPWCTQVVFSQFFVNDGIRSVMWGSNETTTSPAWNYDIDDFIWWTGK